MSCKDCSCHPDAHYTNQTCKHCNRVSKLHVEEVRSNGAYGLLWLCPKCDKVNGVTNASR